MEKELIRLLRASEIECRIATISAKGLSLLLYKDARVDQKILDESFGPFGWKRSYQSIDGNLYCTVSVWDKRTNEWISKQDVGSVGYAEKEKSVASDSFKRACFNWGIGRELYSAPFVWISADKVQIQQKDGKFICNEHFKVTDIQFNDAREISALTISNDKGKILYELKKAGNKSVLSNDQIENLESELKRTGITMEAVQTRYQVKEPEKMNQEIYSKVMSALKKTKSAA